MHIVKVKSKKALNDILKKLDGKMHRAEFLIASEVIERKQLPKKAVVLNYSFLIPPPILISLYAVEGKCKEYEKQYFKNLMHPAVRYFINEAIVSSCELDSDLFIVCSADEEEYGYIDMTCEYIEEYYQVKPISAKKYLAKEEMKGKVDSLLPRAKQYKEQLGRKLKDSYLDVNRLFKKLLYDKDLKRLEE